MKTLKLRIKDKHAKVLTELATQVSFVWNYVNELSFSYLQKHQKFLSAYDIDKYTKGASKECDLHSQTIQAISESINKSWLKLKEPIRKSKFVASTLR